MNKKIIRHLALTAASSLIMASVSAQVTTEVLRDFSACDAGFFRSLARAIPATETPSTIARRGDIAWFKVKNRKEEADNHINFTPPLNVAGLKLLSYFDDASDLDEFGKFYSWGFIAEGSLDQVTATLKPLIRDANRLRRDDNMYARSELKIGKAPWRAVDLSSGSVPLPTTVERVLILEPSDDSNSVRVTCSLQGSVTGDLLKDERPDIDAADYPGAPADGASSRHQ